MKKFTFHRSVTAVLLALLMLLSVIPAAYAAEVSKCSTCDTACTKIVLKQANCHEQGVVEYICVNSKCAAYQKSILVKTDIDPTNHDTICIDNEDGQTHTAHCLYHPEYKNVKEAHTYLNSYCVKCAAADFSQAAIVMKDELEIFIDLNTADATLTAGKVSVMVGNVDITKNYIISYSWVDSNGTVVGTDETFRLPVSVSSNAGDYTYGCFVMAMPKSGTGGKYITSSCTVKVFVREMISASAIVGSKDTAYGMDQTNAATTASVLQQIYQTVYLASDTLPSYVVFDEKPESKIGDLQFDAGAQYYFSPKGSQKSLADVKFVPSDEAAGSYSIRFTAYDGNGQSFPGILTIVVERDLGTFDVAYFSQVGIPVSFSSADFSAYWQELYPGGTLKTVFFSELPETNQGVLYYNYNAYTNTNTPVKETDLFFTVLSSATQYLIDGVTFVPDAKFSGYLTIPFDIYGLRADGFYVQERGKVSIFVNSGEVAEITHTLTPGTAFTFSVSDFLSIYLASTGSKSSQFSLKFLDVPTFGALYTDYTGTVRDKALTAEEITDYTFYSSSELSREIEDLTYVSPKIDSDVTDTMRYLVCDDKGEFVYIGEISLNTKKPVPVYTKSFPDVKKADWFYTYVMDLAEAGIINGFEETMGGVTFVSYKPQDNVTYAQALKLIMLATGYEEQAPTGKHWASGYLTKAKEDALIHSVMTEDRLDEQISRNMIAQIAARAMDLPKSTRTESPLIDVEMGAVYTPYILSLYDAKIINGDTNQMYNGTKKITRAEMATIVWRIMNYTP